MGASVVQQASASTDKPSAASIAGRAASRLIFDLGISIQIGPAIHNLYVLKSSSEQPLAVVVNLDCSSNAADIGGQALGDLRGNSFFHAMSLTASRPPGFRTRAISRKTAGLSGARLMTQLLMTQSTEASARGRWSMVARWNSTFL